MESPSKRLFESNLRQSTDFNEAQINQEFKSQFRASLDQFIIEASKTIKPVSPTDFDQTTGVGILPAPARKMIAREYLAGRQPSIGSYREAEEEVTSTDLVRPLDQAVIHFIIEAGTSSLIASRERNEVLASLLSIMSLVGQPLQTIPDKHGIPVDVKNLTSQIHLITGNAFGQRDYQTFNQQDPEDVQKAVEIYKETLKNLVVYKPSEFPSSPIIAHLIAAEKIKAAIRPLKETGGILNIPWFIYPKKIEVNSADLIQRSFLPNNLIQPDQPFISDHILSRIQYQNGLAEIQEY